MSAHSPRNLADALLVAAAPELLQALQAISRAGTINDQDIIDEMRAAIAKATGTITGQFRMKDP